MIKVTRTAEVPDLLRISRYKKNPELGPKILFFSGGTALTGLSRHLKNYTHNSIHLVSPFDSGGSSAKLRDAFNMPAIGDLRSRLIALADETVLGHPEIYQLFSYRLPQAAPELLRSQLEKMVTGDHPLVKEIANPMRQLICNHLGYFIDAMPVGFNLDGASIGNLIITGGYLNNHKELDSILFLFSKLVNVLGTVKTITNDDYQLVVEQDNADIIVGQHLMTGKEVPAINSPIKSLYLSKNLTSSLPVKAKLKKANRKLICSSDLICYPPGSFYSSLLANLLPSGVGKAIHQNGNAKVFIPNLGNDPEQLGMTLLDSLQTLLEHLQNDVPDSIATDFITFIIIDSQHANYTGGIPYQMIERLGIQLIDTNLMKQGDTKYDDQKLVAALLSLT